MARIIATSLATLALGLFVPAIAAAQDSGLDAYNEDIPSAGGNQGNDGGGGGNDDGGSDSSNSSDSAASPSAETSGASTSSSTSTTPAGPTEVAGNATNSGQTNSKQLPSTGSEQWLLAIVGAALVASGLWLRRRAEIDEMVAELARRRT